MNNFGNDMMNQTSGQIGLDPPFTVETDRSLTPGFETQNYHTSNDTPWLTNSADKINDAILQQIQGQNISSDHTIHSDDWNSNSFQGSANIPNSQMDNGTYPDYLNIHAFYNGFPGHMDGDNRLVGQSHTPLNSPYVVAATASAIANVESPLHNMIDTTSNFTRAPSRTVYLGNLPAEITVKELLDHVRSGVVEDVKILPEKLCAFLSFVDESSALLFHSDAILKRLSIGDKDIKIGWGRPTAMDPLVAKGITMDGATRNVFIGHLNTDPKVAVKMGLDSSSKLITEENLYADLKEFGEIDNIKIIEDKGIAFIHFASIISAIKAVNDLANNNEFYQNKKIYYGKDRCAFITKTQQHNAAQFLGIPPGDSKLLKLSDRELISNALLQQSAAAAAIATTAGGPNNLGNRTVYLGNLPPNTKIEDICNVVRSGLLHYIKLLTTRHVCFVTFIDPTAAAQFYAMTSLHGLVLQKKRCKVGWGKHSGPLPNNIALAVSNGASRNVYIGNVDFENDSKKETPVFTEKNLRSLFKQYGELEQINFLPSKNCCFVNFTNIGNAISAIDKIKSNPVFTNMKINFGKDRCGNIPQQINW